MKRRLLAGLTASMLVLSLAACGGSSRPAQTTAAAAETAAATEAAATEAAPAETEAQPAAEASGATGGKILKTAASFAYPSLDVHTEYYGWYTSIYGLSEALFKIGPDMGLVPCLAESAEI